MNTQGVDERMINLHYYYCVAHLDTYFMISADDHIRLLLICYLTYQISCSSLRRRIYNHRKRGLLRNRYSITIQLPLPMCWLVFQQPPPPPKKKAGKGSDLAVGPIAAAAERPLPKQTHPRAWVIGLQPSKEMG